MGFDSHAVLVVDDDADTLDALEMSLSLAGVDVHGASCGRDAIALIAEGLRPCLVLLDIRMPDLDGWETWRAMRLLPGMASTPVVLCSGEPPDYGRATEAGALAYLRKPITHELLLSTVARYCGPPSAN